MASSAYTLPEIKAQSSPPPSSLAELGLLGDLIGIVFSPAAVLRGLPKSHRIAGVLTLYLALLSAIGYFTYTTGVISREINLQTERALGQLRLKHDADEEVEQANAMIEATDKGRIFADLMAKGWEVIGRPIWSLITILGLAGLLFGLVAFRGGKPVFGVLCGLATFASLAEIPQMLLRLYLIWQLGVTRIETSAAALVIPNKTDLGTYLLLRRANPFEIWHWFIVGYGLIQLRMLKKGSAIFWIGLLWFITALLTCALEASQIADLSGLIQVQAS